MPAPRRLLAALALAAACGSGETEPDAGARPADAATPADPDAGPAPAGLTRYPSGAIRSPITDSVVDRMRAIAAAAPDQRDEVFLKAGASGTVSTNLLYCFAGPDFQPQYAVDLDGRDPLTPTIDWFRTGRIGDATPFDRATLAAEVGRTAGWVLAGDPSPLDQELAAARPRFAFVNYGTNDMEAAASQPAALALFWDRMNDLLDQLEAAGAVPILTGLNPRADNAADARWVPTWDAATRALAEARQLPYISLYVASAPLPDQGLLGDGLHGNVYRTGGQAQPCDFTAAALEFNYNQRNLASIEALDAARRTVIDGGAAPDQAPLPAVAGAGRDDDPFAVDRLPFTHQADSAAGARVRAAYPDCDGGQDESGPELVYALHLDEPTALRAAVLDRGDVDVDLHLLDGGGGCAERADRVIDRTLPAGDHLLVVDTFVSGGVERAGPFSLVILPCEAGDPDC